MSKGKSTQTSQITLPAWQEAQQKELFQAAKGLAGQPFVPYTGPMVAGFNPDQLRQFQATRGLFETGMQYDPLTGLQELAQAPTPTIQPLTGFQAPTISQVTTPTAAQIGGVQAPQFKGLLGADIAAYQSPYQQQVIDVALGDIQRQADIAQQQAQERSIRAGAFGGSRSALLEAEAARPYAEQAARTVAGLRQAGFEQAQRAAESDIARQMQMAQFTPQFQLQAQAQQAGLLGDIQAQNLQRLGLLGGIGAQQQALQQAALEAPYQEFQRALAYGPQQLGLLQAGMGTPLQSTTGTAQQKTGFGDVLAAGGELYALSKLLPLMGGSDERMKKDIKFLGKEKGHNIYSWNWNDKAKSIGWDKYPTIGVIAQEVMKYMPEAVTKNDDGYYMVNYGVL